MSTFGFVRRPCLPRRRGQRVAQSPSAGRIVTPKRPALIPATSAWRCSKTPARAPSSSDIRSGASIGETDALAARKALAARRAGLIAILCGWRNANSSAQTIVMSASPKLDPSPLAPLGPSTTLSRIARVRAPEPPRVSFTPWLAVVLVVVALFRRALRLRSRCDLGRTDGHQIDVRAESIDRRGRNELGHARRTLRRARGRRTRGQHRP